MPQVQKKSQQKTATTVKENKMFRERLRDRYQPSQWVRVINIDRDPFQWQWFPSTDEVEEFTDNGAVRVISGRQHFIKQYTEKLPGNEQTWEIGPGDSEVLIGENADLFIEGLYKRLVTKSFIDDNGDFQIGKPGRSFNWSDGLKQEQYIDKIFLGVEQPTFGRVDEDKPAVGRPRKAQQGA